MKMHLLAIFIFAWSATQAAVGDFSATIDSLTVATGNNTKTALARIGTTHNFAVSFVDPNTYGKLRTFSCDSLGNIGSDTLSTYAWSGTLEVSKQSMIVEDNQAIIAYTSWSDTGKVYTVPLSDAGVITQSKQRYYFGKPGSSSCPSLIRVGSTNYYLLSYGQSNGLWIKSLSISSGTITVVDSLISANTKSFTGNFPGIGRIGNTDYYAVRTIPASYGKIYSFSCDHSNGDLSSTFIDSTATSTFEPYGGPCNLACVNSYSSNLFTATSSDNNTFDVLSNFTIDSTNGDISNIIDAAGPNPPPGSDCVWTPTQLRIGNGYFLYTGNYRRFGIMQIDTSSGAMGNGWTYTGSFGPFETDPYPSMVRCGKEGTTYYILYTFCAGSSFGPVKAASLSVVGGYESEPASPAGWSDSITGLPGTSIFSILGIPVGNVKHVMGIP